MKRVKVSVAGVRHTLKGGDANQMSTMIYQVVNFEITGTLVNSHRKNPFGRNDHDYISPTGL